MTLKLLFFVIASLSIVPYAVDAFAQEDIQLKYDTFAKTTTILVDDKLIFFTPANHNSLASISVQDIKTGSLLYKLYSPHKNLNDDWFGQHMTAVGNNIEASSIFLDPQTDKWTTMVHVFDGQNGNLLYSIENPISNNVHFGYTLKSLGDKLAVYSSDADPNDDIHDNVVHVFDTTNGFLLYIIDNPLEMGHFGKGISTIDNNFLIHNRHYSNDNFSGSIHAFDADTGKLQCMIEYPQEDIRDVDPDFGNESIISENHVIVKSGDAVYIFDGNTGNLVQTAGHPVTTSGQLDAILDSLEQEIQEKTYGDDAPFFGIFAFFENRFSWIMPSQEEIVSEKEYVATFDFEGDDLGNYEKWCTENNGDWLEGYDYGFENSKHHKQARESLRNLTDVYVEGKPAKDACEFLELRHCDRISSLPAKFDMRTGQYAFKHFVDYKDFEVRVHGDGIQYRPNSEVHDESSWIDYESSN